jgi:hypothetical protein
LEKAIQKRRQTVVIIVMDRCTDRNLKLNRDKLKFRRKEVSFEGHLLTSKGVCADPDKVKAVDHVHKVHHANLQLSDFVCVEILLVHNSIQMAYGTNEIYHKEC